jgi:hypothetical protein
MIPAPFAYHRPRSLDETSAHLMATHSNGMSAVQLEELFNNAARPPPQAGQTNPCGQRRSNKNAAQLVSSGKLV